MTRLLSLILPLLFLFVGHAFGQFSPTNDATHISAACNFTVTLNGVQPALCAGTPTGSAFISVTNGIPPIQFFADGQAPAFPNGNLVNIFSAGSHFVVVQDASGCRDTIYFSITEPLPISLTTSFTNALCNGDPDGTATALASGGTGNIGFVWQNCLGGPLLNGATVMDLYAGCYAITATDANGCIVTDSVFVGEPPPYIFNGMQDSVGCFGGSDGSATIEVAGGTPPYGYIWDNGSTMQTATDLDANFHFVTITDANGCQAATFVQVLQPQLLVIDSTNSKMTSCFGGDDGKATVFVKGGTKSYSYLWNDAQAQTAQQAQNLATGTYNVTVTDANGCSATASAVVTSPPELTVNFVNVEHEKCAGDCQGEATIQPSGGTGQYDYFWSNPNIPNGLQTATNLCAGTYTVTVADALGCTRVNKVAISGAVPLDVHYDKTPPSCAGLQDGSIAATISGGAQPYQVQWSNGGTGLIISNLLCGDYFVTITDSLGCVRTDTISLLCPTPIQILNIVPQYVKCFGEANGTLTAQAQGGTGTLTFQWNDPNAQTGAVAVNLLAGNYTLTVTDANSCSATATATVFQPDALTATATKTDVTCFGESDGTAIATAIGGVLPHQFSWNWPQNGQQINNLPAGTYIVTVTDANNCTDTASIIVAEPATPLQATVTQTRTACFGENNGEAFASASGGNGPTFTYEWSDNQIGQTATGLSVGFISVTATDSRGCSVIQSIEIQQFDSIEVNVIFVPPSCFGLFNGAAAINLVNGGAGMGDTTLYNYQWSMPNSPNSIYVGNLASGAYSVTATDLQGCSGSFSFFITQPPRIQAEVLIKNVSCFGFSDGSAEVIGVQNANLPVNYSWSTGASGTSITDVPAGNYLLDMEDALGCKAQDTIRITEPEILAVNFEIQALVCNGDNDGSITATISGGTPDYDLQWNTGASTPTISDLGPGIYVLNILDKNGCARTDSATVIRPDSIVIQTEKTEPPCFGAANGRLRLLVSGGQMPYRYSINGGAFGGSSVFLGLKAGVYSFQVKDGKGCITTVIDSLSEPLTVGVSAGLDTTIVLGDSILLAADVFNAFGMVAYEWESALLENFTCADTPVCSMIWVKPFQTNTYRVVVTDENGCRGQDAVKVNVEKPRGVYVPSGFTPNGDFTNDLLIVYGKGQQVLKVLTFRVYDRWGELVFSDENFNVNDETRGWDGLFKGKECDPGVYVWVLEAEYKDGFRELLKGNVTLIR